MKLQEVCAAAGLCKVDGSLCLTSKRVQFVCGEKQDEAFGKMQWFLTNVAMLALPDPDAPYKVVCDACGYGLGAVLLQNQKPIA